MTMLHFCTFTGHFSETLTLKILSAKNVVFLSFFYIHLKKQNKIMLISLVVLFYMHLLQLYVILKLPGNRFHFLKNEITLLFELSC